VADVLIEKLDMQGKANVHNDTSTTIKWLMYNVIDYVHLTDVRESSQM